MTEFVINKTIRIVTTFSQPTTAPAEEIPLIGYANCIILPGRLFPLMTGILEGDNKQPYHSKHLRAILGDFIYHRQPGRDGIAGQSVLWCQQSRSLQSISTVPLLFIPVRGVPSQTPAASRILIWLSGLTSAEEGAPDMSIGAPLFPDVEVAPWLLQWLQPLIPGNFLAMILPRPPPILYTVC